MENRPFKKKVRETIDISESSTETSYGIIAQTPKTGSDAVIYAGFLRRAFADILDAMIWPLIQFPLLAPAGFSLMAFIGAPKLVEAYVQQPQGIIFALLALPLTMIGLAVPWFYTAYSESSRFQATAGKRIVGLKVTNELGENIGFWRSTWKLVLVMVLTFVPVLLVQFLLAIVNIGIIPLPKEITGGLVSLEYVAGLIPILLTLSMFADKRKQTIYDKLSKRLVLIQHGWNFKFLLITIVGCALLYSAELALGLSAKNALVDFINAQTINESQIKANSSNTKRVSSPKQSTEIKPKSQK